MPTHLVQKSSLTILTLQENAGGTLSNQITGIGRLMIWSGKKLIGLIHTSNDHADTTFAKTSSSKNFDTSLSIQSHNLSPTDTHKQQSSPQEILSTSLSKEEMTSRIIASATVGLLIGGLPGALACSGATFTGIQIKRTLASHDDKLLPTLPLIALNLTAVILPDAEEISTAYSDGRYADALTTFITKAPANLLLGAILKTFIQSNIENLANHCLPEFAKPKNNELTSAAFNGVSDALAVHASPILRKEIATFCSNHLPQFPLTSAHAIPSLNDTSIDTHGSGDNSTSLSIYPTSTYSRAISPTLITTSSSIGDSSTLLSTDSYATSILPTLSSESSSTPAPTSPPLDSNDKAIYILDGIFGGVLSISPLALCYIFYRLDQANEQALDERARAKAMNENTPLLQV